MVMEQQWPIAIYAIDEIEGIGKAVTLRKVNKFTSSPSMASQPDTSLYESEFFPTLDICRFVIGNVPAECGGFDSDQCR